MTAPVNTAVNSDVEMQEVDLGKENLEKDVGSVRGREVKKIDNPFTKGDAIKCGKGVVAVTCGVTTVAGTYFSSQQVGSQVWSGEWEDFNNDHSVLKIAVTEPITGLVTIGITLIVLGGIFFLVFVLSRLCYKCLGGKGCD